MSSKLLTVEEVMAWGKDAKALTQLNDQFYAKQLNQHRHYGALGIVAREQGLIEHNGHKNRWVRGDITEPVAWVLLKGVRTYVDAKTARRGKAPKTNGSAEPELPGLDSGLKDMSRLDRIEARVREIEGRVDDLGEDIHDIMRGASLPPELEQKIKLMDVSIKTILADLV